MPHNFGKTSSPQPQNIFKYSHKNTKTLCETCLKLALCSSVFPLWTRDTSRTYIRRSENAWPSFKSLQFASLGQWFLANLDVLTIKCFHTRLITKAVNYIQSFWKYFIYSKNLIGTAFAKTTTDCWKKWFYTRHLTKRYTDVRFHVSYDHSKK